MNAFISRIILGVTISVVGVALLVDALALADTGSILARWWPSLIIIGGVAMLINDMKNYLWPLIIIVVGALVQLRVLGYTDVNPWQIFWPLVLIGVGVSIMLKRPSALRRESKADADDIVAILGGTNQNITADNFTHSEVTAVMGGAKIDLRAATIKKTATIDVFTLMGGIEVVVPRGVVVKNQLSVILGGVEDKTDQEVSKDSPTLVLVGDVILGGVEIKN